ncbi:MAG: hypothetical protein ACSHYF_16025 [Verrucomicrobiaceae bacterium]
MSTPTDFIRPWFEALEELDEFIGVRFGQLNPATDRPDWHFIGHQDVDGIGGFARLLRARGLHLPDLPTLTHPGNIGLPTLLGAIPGTLKSRKPIAWLESENAPSHKDTPPTALAWHAFTPEETDLIRTASRQQGITVNTLLLKHLDTALRTQLADPQTPISWMVPVNLRGKISRPHDEDNHSSYVTAQIKPHHTPTQLHTTIRKKLALGQHLLNWKTYSLGRVVPAGLKKKIIQMDRVMSEPCLGAFSNLGQWDQEKTWDHQNLAGPWFFSPPVLRCQPLGAGCLTFQNQLTLTLQLHPQISTKPPVAQGLVSAWRELIRLDFS